MKHEVRLERLKWMLLAAVSGASVGSPACGGRSERDPVANGKGGEQPASAGRAGANGGVANQGTSTAGATSTAGTLPTNGGGSAVAGVGGSTVDPGPSGCAAAAPFGGSGNLVRCAGDVAHRPTASACAIPERVAPSDAGSGGQAADTEVIVNCGSDLDCNDEANGFCVFEPEKFDRPASQQCIYACNRDADCGQGEICVCGDAYTRATTRDSLVIGVCRTSACTTDASCGENLLCIAQLRDACGSKRPNSFQCQGAGDECTSRLDCIDEVDPGGVYCEFYDDGFRCEQADCGRPFVVGAAVRRAEVAKRNDWLDSALHPEPAGELSGELRARVARHFVEAGLMEHASIAAFARFALQLLALGAPAELVAATASAIDDETRHTKLCFSLAARYGAHESGPGPLDVRGALETLDLQRVVDLAIVEGCIGETCAALEAGWAADAAVDPVVRRTLLGIAEDEARHAALAFRFVAWAAGRDAGVLALLERRLTEALAADTAPRSGCEVESLARETLARHGVLDASSRSDARRAALSEIVLPTVRALVAPTSSAPNLAHEQVLSC